MAAGQAYWDKDQGVKYAVILKIDSDIEKRNIARTILESLPDWFGIPESTEEYIVGVTAVRSSAPMQIMHLLDFFI